MSAWLSFMTDPASLPVWGKVLLDGCKSGVIPLTILYCSSQGYVRDMFKDRRRYEDNKPFWKKFMMNYNLVMAAYSCITFFVCLRGLLQTGLLSTECDTTFRNPYFNWAAYIFYWSKYVEFLDTFFLIIAGKQVSWLQFFRHAGAPIDMWVLYNYENEGIWIFVQFNSLIHTFMYTYYFFTAMGKKIELKVFVTVLQILQLVVGNTISLFYLSIPCYRKDYFRMAGWTVNMFYICVLVALFAEFFYDAYIKKGDGKKSADLRRQQPGAVATNGTSQSSKKHA